MRIVRQGDWLHMPWKNGGGTTAEIAVHPPGAGMADFGWRLSAATVEREGPFSLFDGVDRTLIVLGDNGIALNAAAFGSVILTASSAPFSFAADQPVGSTLSGGPVLDLNIMTRRGAYAHTVQRVAIGGRFPIAPACDIMIVHCLGPEIMLQVGGRERQLRPRDTAILEPASGCVALARTASEVLVVGIEDHGRRKITGNGDRMSLAQRHFLYRHFVDRFV